VKKNLATYWALSSLQLPSDHTKPLWIPPRNQGIFYPLSWIWDEFLPDPGSGPFWLVKLYYIIFRILVMLSLWNWATLKPYSWNCCKQQEKSIFTFAAPFFYIERRIRDEKILGSGIKHSGSATLSATYGLYPLPTRTNRSYLSTVYSPLVREVHD
jgi:hypothetical protein